MKRSPTRWLATLAVLSGLLTALPAGVEARLGQQPPNRVTQQAPRVQVPTTAMPDLVGLALPVAQRQPVVVKFSLALVAESIESFQYPPGTITRQSVPPGQSVRAGTRIVVSVVVGGVAVPPVEGQPIESARALLQKLGFGAEVSFAPSTRLRPGIVSRQAPRPGTLRPRGSVVQLEVASPIPNDPRQSGRSGVDVSPGGKEWTVVPNVVNVDERTALALVEKSRLKGRVRHSRSPVKPGVVVDQVPKDGTRVAPGSVVDITVSIPLDVDQLPPPPPPPTRYMPNLVGRTVEDALADAMVRQLRLRITARDDSMANGRPGLIVRQSVVASAPIEPGSPVSVWIATGVVVPELVGLGVDAARQQLGVSGLQARVNEVVRDRDAGNVVAQTPVARTVVPRGAAVGLSVAVLEMVRVPDVGGRDRDGATSLLTASRLTGDFSNDQESALTPGLVSGQDPPPGSEVPVGAAVRVRVASGVVVPSVIGTTPGEARARLTSRGLTVESRETRTNRSGANTVFEQAPGAGQRVARGTAVLLSVALPPLVTVPDVGRRQGGEAASLLAAAQLKGDFTNDLASELAPGLVAAQDPPSGSQVVAGTVVHLSVAVGVVVPSVVGVRADEAQTRIASSGLRASATEVRTDAAPAGTVFEQSPRAGQRAARGSLLELSVARPPLVTVPDLAQRTRTEAMSVAQAVRLEVAFEDDPASTLPPDRVSRQDPPPGASVEVGVTVRAALATGVLVPSVVNMPVRSARALLEAAGLPTEERGEVSDRVPESTVVQQSPESNARVALGSAVRLIVAIRRMVTVPELLGRVRSDVEQLLAPIPLDARFEQAATADAAAVPGTVVQQVPVAGATVGAGTVVRVVLAQAGATVPVNVPPGVARSFDLTSIIPWIAGLGLFSLVVYRFVNANRAGIESKRSEGQPTRVPQVNLEPQVEEMTSGLEVSGSALIQFEVRIRTGADIGQQSLSVEGSLTGNERRLYE